jgi:hypothetical protein
MDIKKSLTDLINSRGSAGTTFARILHAIPDARGDFEMAHFHENIILYEGLSKEAIEALQELISAGSVRIAKGSVGDYVILETLGAPPKLPLALSVRTYMTPRWLPVLLFPAKGPLPENLTFIRQ